MTDPSSEPQTTKPPLEQAVGKSANRKIAAQRETVQGVWRGLGMMGIVGWSVVVPTLAGAALGGWLDEHHPKALSWTLSLLIAGLAIGCANAWHWVTKERTDMHEGHVAEPRASEPVTKTRAGDDDE